MNPDTIEAEFLPRSLRDQLPPATGSTVRVLYFMRTIDCPICRGHVRRLAELTPELARWGAAVAVVAPSEGADRAADWIARQPFPVLVTDQAHQAAGLERALFGSIQQSGTLVVDTDGRVLLSRRATVPFRAFDEGELRRFLERDCSPCRTIRAAVAG